jgi:phage terminase small subunit
MSTKVLISKVLTPMQYSFCSEYVRNGGNAKQAALTAGYSASYSQYKAPALVFKPHIAKRMESAIKRVESKLDVSFEWRINKLKRLVNDIIPDDDSPIKTTQGKVATQALAEINKMYGDYAPEKRMNMTVNATLDKLTEARKAYEEF